MYLPLVPKYINKNYKVISHIKRKKNVLCIKYLTSRMVWANSSILKYTAHFPF